MRQFLSFHQLAGDARWGARSARRHDDTNARVTASTHCTSTGVNHKTYQKPKQHLQPSLWVFSFYYLLDFIYFLLKRFFTRVQLQCTYILSVVGVTETAAAANDNEYTGKSTKTKHKQLNRWRPDRMSAFGHNRSWSNIHSCVTFIFTD